jgi:endo-1,4-beta-xylanase
MRNIKPFLAALVFALAVSAAFAADAPKGTRVSSSDFEDGTLQGWGPRGTEKVAVTQTVAHGGKSSLLVSNRTTTWQGPIHSLDDKLAAGGTYVVTGFVRYDEGPAAANFTVSVEKSFKDASASHTYTNVKSFNGKKGEWIPIEIEIPIPSDISTYDKVWFYIELPYKSDDRVTADDKISFAIDDFSVALIAAAARMKPQDNIPNLREAVSNWFPLGAAVDPEMMDRENPIFRLITRHFDAVTPGNMMKPDTIQAKEGQFSFDQADTIVEFAQLTGKLVHGHTLVWHSQTPNWFFQDPNDPSKPASKALLLKRLETHIKTTVGHFKGQIDSWDVVNEPISDSVAGLRGPEEGSKWYGIIGPEYIEKAFIWAHEADPDATLVINDYSLESNVIKRNAMAALVKSLLAKRIPVGAVGLQMHINSDTPTADQVRETIDTFAALGVKVQVTEMDVSVYAWQEPKKTLTEEMFLKQARQYAAMFKVFKEEAEKNRLTRVILWGVDDGHSWLNDFPVPGRGDAPLLFDANYQAKPAFWAIVDPSKVPNLAAPVVVSKTGSAVMGTPVVDGKTDGVWSKAAVYRTDTVSIGEKAATAKFQVLWDSSYLYVLATVTDKALSAANANPWEQDSVEVFLDQLNSKTPSYQKEDGQYRISYKNVITVAGNADPKTMKTAATVTSDGYIVEIAIPFTVVMPKAGDKIGFDFQVNDDDGSGKRTGIRTWNDPTNTDYLNPAKFGTLTLSAK